MKFRIRSENMFIFILVVMSKSTNKCIYCCFRIFKCFIYFFNELFKIFSSESTQWRSKPRHRCSCGYSLDSVLNWEVQLWQAPENWGLASVKKHHYCYCVRRKQNAQSSYSSSGFFPHSWKRVPDANQPGEGSGFTPWLDRFNFREALNLTNEVPELGYSFHKLTQVCL